MYSGESITEIEVGDRFQMLYKGLVLVAVFPRNPGTTIGNLHLVKNMGPSFTRCRESSFSPKTWL